MPVNWKEVVYYDITSPTFLRWKSDIRWGRGYGKIKCSRDDPAGTYGRDDYDRVGHEGVRELTHNIIWKLHFGPIPLGLEIDHIDGDKMNHAIDNLRAVTRKINNRNRKIRMDNKSGTAGVYFEDRGFPRYIATWRNEEGKQCKKSFSVKLYGPMAKERAKTHRHMMIKQLNFQGAGYTERHGT